MQQPRSIAHTYIALRKMSLLFSIPPSLVSSSLPTQSPTSRSSFATCTIASQSFIFSKSFPTLHFSRHDLSEVSIAQHVSWPQAAFMRAGELSSIKNRGYLYTSSHGFFFLLKPISSLCIFSRVWFYFVPFCGQGKLSPKYTMAQMCNSILFSLALTSIQKRIIFEFNNSLQVYSNLLIIWDLIH